jgi:hypothetical protein
MQRAGGIDHRASGLHPLGAVVENTGLQGDQFRHRFRGLSPAGIGVTVQGAESGAGGIDQQAIAGPDKRCTRLTIQGVDFDIGIAQPIAILRYAGFCLRGRRRHR